jgi:hypothetical protein
LTFSSKTDLKEWTPCLVPQASTTVKMAATRKA